MKIVIVGAGAVGFQIANHLIAENMDIAVIEQNPDRAKFVNNNLDCFVVCGSGTSINSLKEAGIEKADFFISVTNSDEVNMISCGIVSSEFNVANKIARIRNLQYIDSKIISNKFLGIDYIVNPETEASKQILRTIESGATSDIISFEKTEVQLRNINIINHPEFAHKTLKEIKNEINEDFLIAAISRGKEIIIPFGETRLHPEDTIFIVAEQKSFENIFYKIGQVQKDIKKVLIVGGGKIGKSVIEQLTKSKDKKITLLDSNYSVCKQISNKYPEVLVLNSDITNEKIFEEEQIHKYDLIVTITNNEELNVLSALYAKKLGTSRSISLVINSNYIHLSSQLGIDSVVSPKISSVNSILKFIRSGNITSVYSIFDGQAEIVEFNISDNNPLNKKLIKDVNLPTDSLIIGISRNGKNIIPDGNLEINSGDTIITIASKNSINKIHKLFNI